MEKKWWKEGIVYQIYPRSFFDSNGDGIGDLPGILEKLDYLKDLGATILWLNPVYKSPNHDNGYDISDYHGILEEFGTSEAWENLLSEIHKRNMKLIMDIVVNHTSDEHPWFIKSRSSMDSPYRDYYIWLPPDDGAEPNNWDSFFSGSAWEWDSRTSEYYLHLFTKNQPDLNWKNPKVREEIYTMMRWWLDKGIDGFRLDTINLLSKTDGFPSDMDNAKANCCKGKKYYVNGPRIHEYLREMNEQVFSRYPIMTVGECPETNIDEALKYTGEERNEINMLFNFEHMKIDYGKGDKWNPVPWKLSDLKHVIDKWQTLLHGRSWNALYFTNHDQPRALSRFGNDKEYRTQSAKLLATLLLTLEGTPYIYQGEEIGMTNISFGSIEEYRDIETINYYRKALSRGIDKSKIMKSIHYTSRDNSRTPMQWDNSKNGGFTRGTPWITVNNNYPDINVKNEIRNEDSIYHYYKKLIKIRCSNPCLIYGDYSSVVPEHKEIFAYLRSYKEEQFLIALNFSEESVSLNFRELSAKKAELLQCNYKTSSLRALATEMRPYEARIYRLL